MLAVRFNYRTRFMAFQDLDQWTPQLPRTRQAGVEFEQWAAHAATRHCERLIKGDCLAPCGLKADSSYEVDFEHITPQISGGSSGIYNTRLLCSNANSAKRDGLDQHYAKTTGFFDQPLNAQALRPVQRAKGADLIRGRYKHLFSTPPDELFSVFMVLCWLVGTGKTLGMVANILAINEVRRQAEPNGWRVRRVLWLVHQTTLVRSTATELGGMTKGRRVIQSEIVEHNICTRAPEVQCVEKPEDWIIGMDADIVVATPQCLWDTKGRTLTRERKAQILAGFDLIVVDECQYAVERYMEICDLAPKTLKFAVSSTHFDKNGTYLSQIDNGRYQNKFRLFSVAGYDEDAGIYKRLHPVFADWRNNSTLIEQAIADYQQAAKRSDIPRHHRPAFPAIDGDHYHRVAGGKAEIAQGSEIIGHVDDDTEHYNSIRKNAVIKRCRELASEEHWQFDSHVMLKFGSISECKQFASAIESDAKEHNAPTWGATAVYAGSKGENLGSPDHPWMLAKSNNGKVKKGSKRFVCVVDIGQFGINQPACAIIGWCDTTMTMIDIVQRIGRAIRARPGIDGDMKFAWNGASDASYEFTIQLHKAVDYILNMEDYVAESFLPLADLTYAAEPLPMRPVTGQPLPKERRLEIIEVLGTELLVDPDLEPDELLNRVSRIVYGGTNGRVPEQAKEYIQDLVNRGPEIATQVKNDLFSLPSILTPISYISSEEPSMSFTKEEVYKEIMGSLHFTESSRKNEWKLYLEGDDEARKTWHKRLFEKRMAEHSVPAGAFHPHEILGVQRARKVFGRTYSRRLEQILAPALRHSSAISGIEYSQALKDLETPISRSLYAAAARVFGLSNFKQVTIAPRKDQIANALCAPDVERAILSFAYGRLLSKWPQYFPGLHRVLEDQISQVAGHLEATKSDA